ncbi:MULTISPECIES: hypothetical protein [unclassified Bradyrhizobium]|uniref:hypothetical protein n=1 Tax=unclassified Bradyrhizobium TaxID=2631580 RepID=UPI0028E8C554|nr:MULTISPECIES: hypothetical protein [unclassified Bradyrhizobium]
MTVDLAALKADNLARWRRATPTRDFSAVVRRLVASRARYQAVAAQTGVPWYLVAVIHERESSQSWSASLAQGDPWDRVSVHVPAGRGPFKSWEDAAVDALVNCAPYAARWKDWSIGGTLTLLEQYNGLGYFRRGVPSPYIWAGTDQYRSGKYVRDGVYDPDAVDKQLGCAGLLLAMKALDVSIFPATTSVPSVPPSSQAMPSPQPSITHPAKGSIGDLVAGLVRTVILTFKRS